MRTFWATMAVGLLALGSLHADLNQPMFCGQIATGYRQENFRWGFKGLESSSSSSSDSDFNGGTVGSNITGLFNGSSSSSDDDDAIFVQKWKTVRIAETTAYFSYVTCNNYYARINGGYGHIMHGQVKSKSFTNLLKPHQLTAEINGDGGSGQVMDFEACVGYQFSSNGGRFICTPVLGYSWHNQGYKMKDAEQEFNRLDVPSRLGKIDRLRFSYRPHWYGPFFGMEFMTLVENPCFVVYGYCEWHWSDKFRSKGRWKFHDHVFHDSFDAGFLDHAIGHGVYGYLGLDYRIGCGWYMGVVGYYRHFIAHHGRHKMTHLFTDIPTTRQNFGSIPVLGSDAETHLKNVQWVSWSAAFAVTYRYYDP
jgi:hypothetical protein